MFPCINNLFNLPWANKTVPHLIMGLLPPINSCQKSSQAFYIVGLVVSTARNRQHDTEKQRNELIYHLVDTQEQQGVAHDKSIVTDRPMHSTWSTFTCCELAGCKTSFGCVIRLNGIRSRSLSDCRHSRSRCLESDSTSNELLFQRSKANKTACLPAALHMPQET